MGDRKEDLVPNLLKAYHVTLDTEFVQYIKTKK